MLTPQEAESHVFPKASFGGYNMLQVDTFLDSLIEDYRTLYQENTSLKNKMKVLVDKVEEYRATEDAMRMTLHSAQKMADAMVKEGEAKKQAAIDQAVSAAEARSQAVRGQLEQEEQKVRAQLEAVRQDLANEQARLEAARAATTAYIAQLKELYTKEIQYIGSLSNLTAPPVGGPCPAQRGQARRRGRGHHSPGTAGGGGPGHRGLHGQDLRTGSRSPRLQRRPGGHPGL